MPDGFNKSWYDSSMVRGGHNFKVDYKVDMKRVHRVFTREHFKYFKGGRWTLV